LIGTLVISSKYSITNGETITDIVEQVQARIHQYRLSLKPAVPEIVHSPGCEDKLPCAKDWEYSYAVTAIFFAHTQRFFTGREVFDMLKRLNSPALFSARRELTLKHMDTQGVLWREEELIKEGAQSIMDYLKAADAPLPRPPPRFRASDEEIA
jgi:hypothetical protein